jgi:hypothetical protein
MEEVVERSISVSGWYPWCEQPRMWTGVILEK